MAKYENIRALAKKQLQAVTESSDHWKAFMQTAAFRNKLPEVVRRNSRLHCPQHLAAKPHRHSRGRHSLLE